VTLMHDALTAAGRSLTQTNQTPAIDHIRHRCPKTIEAEFREAVEPVTGRKVLAFVSRNHVDPDIARGGRSDGRAIGHPPRGRGQLR
jgi:uncharacterized protein YbcI